MTYALDSRMREYVAAAGAKEKTQDVALAAAGTAAANAVSRAVSAQRAAGQTPEDFGAVGNGVADDTAAVVAWASSTGRLRVTDGAIYRITAPITVTAKRIDATGGVFFYDPPSATEHIMFNFVTPGTRWTGGEIDGNLKARTGIDSAAGRIRIRDLEAHGFRSISGRADAIRLTGPDGGEVRHCELYDTWAQGNANSGDGVGPTRGVMISHNAPLNAPYYVTDNLVYDIWGEEGDGIHMLLFGGTYPFYDSAGSVIARNRIYGCGRRCIKVQASNISVDDNDAYLDGGNPPAGQSATPRLSTIGAISSAFVRFRRNTVRCSVDASGLAVANAGIAGTCQGAVVEGNTLIGGGDVGLYLDGLTDSFIGMNIFKQCKTPLAMGNSNRCFIDLQVIIDAVNDGTAADITVQAECSHIVVARSLGLSGTRYGLVSMRAPKSIVVDTYDLRSTSTYAAIGGSTAIDSIIDGVVAATDGASFAVSASEAVWQVGNVKNLGTTTEGSPNGRGGRVFWVSSNPTTARASRKHNRGDIAMNDGAGSEVGWRCTATGTPGTWVAFS